MTTSSTTAAAAESLSDRQLTGLLALAFSQPMKLLGQTEASLSSYAVFWCVASREGQTQIEVAHITGLSAKTVSRVITQLGVARDGLGWIRQVNDDNDRRVRRLFLSRKGKTVLTRLLKEMRKPANNEFPG